MCAKEKIPPSFPFALDPVINSPLVGLAGEALITTFVPSK